MAYETTMSVMRKRFLILQRELKIFGKTSCRFHENRKNKSKSIMECHHPSTAYGGINRNTDCELENCPRIIYGDEG